MAAITGTVAMAAFVVLAVAVPASAAPALTVEVTTWNVIGLDSNDVTSGPATYPVGAWVCNPGTDAAPATTATFVWTTTNAAIDLASPATTSIGSIAPGACVDVYWDVTVVRSVASFDASRGYEIDVSSSAGVSAVTPSPRELYVERLISQNRNSVNSIVGPTAVTVGDEVTYTVDASTATNGYEQIEAFLTLNPSIFQLLRTTVSYAAPPATSDRMYADACGWDDVPTSPTYRSCIGPEGIPGGKAGGALISTYTVRIVGEGTTSLTSAIYDKSGSSYHYNSDFTVAPNLLVVTATAPPPTTTTTTVAPATTTSTAVATTTTLPAASPRASMPATGRSDSMPLSLFALGLIAFGSATLGIARIENRRLDPLPLERSAHHLRVALYAHEDEPIAAKAWPMLDALERVVAQLR